MPIDHKAKENVVATSTIIFECGVIVVVDASYEPNVPLLVPIPNQITTTGETLRYQVLWPAQMDSKKFKKQWNKETTLSSKDENPVDINNFVASVGLLLKEGKVKDLATIAVRLRLQGVHFLKKMKILNSIIAQPAVSFTPAFCGLNFPVFNIREYHSHFFHIFLPGKATRMKTKIGEALASSPASFMTRWYALSSHQAGFSYEMDI
ncbi:hypothetical protein CK203_106322 [Vitis vinifera]|uniref:Uncharacterized protein n=1 Tax=Vitis vinifera TaxID=29760 RepID=A0A438CDT0_VITVI|nr:hypothetical protein CK203_106322 [Vitis vinifera]